MTSEPSSLLRDGVVVFARNRLAVIGAAMVATLVVFCFTGPLFFAADPTLTDLSQANQPPGTGKGVLGTDNVGRDQLQQLMVGGRTSIVVATAAALLALVLGATWGAIAGYVGGVVDGIMMRIVDALMAIPGLFLLIVIASMLEASVPVLIIVLAGASWLGAARLVRGEALTIRTREYVEAVRMMGGTRRRAVMRHILPGAIGTMAVNATFQVALAVLALAALGFLGLGVPPPANDWGSMLSTGVQYAYNGYWWLFVPPGLAIVLLVLGLNFMGDGLRDAFDSRLQTR